MWWCCTIHKPWAFAPLLHRNGMETIWRCHIGSDTADPITADAWTFLAPYLGDPAAFVFSRASYRPPQIPADRPRVITPSLDPLSTKNQPLDATDVVQILTYNGLLDGPPVAAPHFTRRNGSAGRLQHRAEVLQLGPAPSPQEPLVLQVSRWDRLKNIAGLMTAFADRIATSGSGPLILAGPDVSGVSDDPEGAAELQACVERWHRLPEGLRRRIHVASLPVMDTEENALIVNALQRHAAVVTQKSVAEGFGPPVLEAMWKGRPIVASAWVAFATRSPTDVMGCSCAIHGIWPLRRPGSSAAGRPGLAMSAGQHAATRAVSLLPDHRLAAWADLFVDLTAR